MPQLGVHPSQVPERLRLDSCISGRRALARPRIPKWSIGRGRRGGLRQRDLALAAPPERRRADAAEHAVQAPRAQLRHLPRRPEGAGQPARRRSAKRCGRTDVTSQACSRRRRGRAARAAVGRAVGPRPLVREARRGAGGGAAGEGGGGERRREPRLIGIPKDDSCRGSCRVGRRSRSRRGCGARSTWMPTDWFRCRPPGAARTPTSCASLLHQRHCRRCRRRRGCDGPRRDARRRRRR